MKVAHGISKPTLVKVQQELETVRLRHDGLLRPEDIVEFARDKRTTLHAQFEWNNGKAAEQFRLEQARHIIRVVVTVIDMPEAHEPITVRAYQSLTTDRGSQGYRATVDVLSVKELRDQMLKDAIDELVRIRTKYATLKELTKVHEAIDELTR